MMGWLGRCNSFMMSDVDLLVVPSPLPDFEASTIQVVQISSWHVCDLFHPVYIKSQYLCH